MANPQEQFEALANRLPLGRDPESVRQRIEAMERVLERLFVGVDTLLGAIPWVGAIPDFFFRSNTRNLRIVRKWLDKHHPSTGVIEGEVVRRETL